MARRILMLVGMLVLLAPICSPVYAFEGNPMPLVPTLTISALDPLVAFADVTDEDLDTVTFHGNVTVDKPPVIGIVMVNLDGTTNAGWVTVVSPQSIPFTSPATVPITVTVTIPPNTPTAITATTTVNGLATFPGGSKAASSTASIKVRPFFKCALNASPRLGTENPQFYNLMINNAGNGEDTFSLNIQVQAALEKAGLSFSFETTKTQKLAMGSNQTLKLTVKYGATAASGKKDFYVRVTSEGAKNAGNESGFTDILLTIDVKPLSGTQGLSIGLLAGAIIVAVGVTLFVAKKKGKLRFGKKAKDVPKEKATKEK